MQENEERISEMDISKLVNLLKAKGVLTDAEIDSFNRDVLYHKPGSEVYTSNPPKYKCQVCNQYYYVHNQYVSECKGETTE